MQYIGQNLEQDQCRSSRQNSQQNRSHVLLESIHHINVFQTLCTVSSSSVIKGMNSIYHFFDAVSPPSQEKQENRPRHASDQLEFCSGEEVGAPIRGEETIIFFFALILPNRLGLPEINVLRRKMVVETNNTKGAIMSTRRVHVTVINCSSTTPLMIILGLFTSQPRKNVYLCSRQWLYKWKTAPLDKGVFKVLSYSLYFMSLLTI